MQHLLMVIPVQLELLILSYLDDDYMQLDLAYGDLTLSVIDTDAGTTFTACHTAGLYN